jgi:Lrp/AsnC family transcriptional regulator, leucine-responsive regulatory protein
MPTDLDPTDRRILRVLQQDGKILNTELSERVGLSPSPVLRRVRLLEEQGVIERYVALLNPASVSLAMTIFVRITLERQDQATVEAFANEVRNLPQVMEAHLMAGTYDYLLKVAVSDLEDYRRVHMDHFAKMPGVRNVVTEIPLQNIKQTTELPI